MFSAERECHASIAHRLNGHKGACANIHGHNYVFSLRLIGPSLNSMGMVVDFGDIKKFWDDWIKENWDHRLILWKTDSFCKFLNFIRQDFFIQKQRFYKILNTDIINKSLVIVDFNPTAENMAAFLYSHVRKELWDRNILPYISMITVTVEETEGNTATFSRNPHNED